MLPRLPAVSWNNVADVCTRAATPVYRTVRKTLSEDVDQLAQLVADLEPISLEDYEPEESVCAVRLALLNYPRHLISPLYFSQRQKNPYMVSI